MAILRFGAATAAIVAALTAGTPAETASLAPHRATYQLTLDPAKAGSKISQASGLIAFELVGNACEGYSVALRQVTRLDTGEGQASTSDLQSATWEAGDAQRYRFESKNVINDESRERVDGSAERNPDGGLTVRLSSPKSEVFELSGRIALPTQHLIMLIDAAAAGDRIVEAQVFDGAPDGRKVYDTLAVIGAAIKDGPAPEKPAGDLASVVRYPVTVSYFEQGTGERTPTYVLSFDLYENGISRALKLDYGNFALRGELSSLEMLTPTPCKQ